MIYTDDLVAFIKGWEKLKLVASPDKLVPKYTDIGYGHVVLPHEKFTKITEVEANEILTLDLNWRAEVLNRMLKVKAKQHEFDALLSFGFNVGMDDDDDVIAEGLGDSSLLKRFNEGNVRAAAEWFPLWCFANGAMTYGLLKRRVAEQSMFIYGYYGGRP